MDAGLEAVEPFNWNKSLVFSNLVMKPAFNIHYVKAWINTTSWLIKFI